MYPGVWGWEALVLGQDNVQSQGACLATAPTAKAWPVPDAHEDASPPVGKEGVLWREVGHNSLSDILPKH